MGLGPAPTRRLTAPSPPFSSRRTLAVRTGTALAFTCASVQAQPDAFSASPSASPASLEATPIAPTLPPSARPAESAGQEQSHSSDVETFLSEVRHSCGQSATVKRFVAALMVELGATPFARPDPEATRVLRCDIEAATLTLLANGHDVTIDVSDVPVAARARTLAVALAETLRLPPQEVHLTKPNGDGAATGSEGEVSKLVSPLASPHDEGQVPQRLVSANVEPVRVDTVGIEPVRPEPMRPEPMRPESTGPEPMRIDRPWRAAVMLSALVQGEKNTIAPGVNFALSGVLSEGLRLSGQVGYLTAAASSSLGRARLHAGNVEVSLDYLVLEPSPHTTLDVGAGVALHGALVTVHSAWGVDEQDLNAWFALVHARSTFTTTVSDRVRWLTELRVVKDAVGLQLNAGGQEAMSFHGWGGELRLGAAYVW